MPGRRWSDGLHQAVEAKEGVQIDRETQTLATITIQNYFRLYQKLAGMTGTAETEAAEFHDIYKLDVNVIPTNRPVARRDHNDRIYKTRREKYNAVINEIREHHTKQQPVLVGTVRVEASEILSRMLKREKIPHNVLNAKIHMQEAEIVARAGQPGTVTISTNMDGEVVYPYRNEVIDSEDPRTLIYEVIDEAVPAKLKEYLEVDEPNYGGLIHWVNTTFPLGLTKDKVQFDTRNVDENAQFLIGKVKEAYERKSSHEEPTAVKSLERYIILNAIDRLWQEHLYAMDALRSE